jgi:Poxvirus D5 protein-like
MVEGAIALLGDLRDGGDYALTEAQQARIDRLMDQSDSVKRFVQEGVVKCKGQDVAGTELLSAYYGFCEDRGWQPFPTKELHADLKKYMLEIHRANSAHDITRNCKSVRGYRHVGLVGGGLEND